MKSSCFVGAVIVLLMAFGAMAQVPLVNQGLIPASVAPGSQAFALTVNGTGFKFGRGGELERIATVDASHFEQPAEGDD